MSRRLLVSIRSVTPAAAQRSAASLQVLDESPAGGIAIRRRQDCARKREEQAAIEGLRVVYAGPDLVQVVAAPTRHRCEAALHAGDDRPRRGVELDDPDAGRIGGGPHAVGRLVIGEGHLHGGETVARRRGETVEERRARDT